MVATFFRFTSFCTLFLLLLSFNGISQITPGSSDNFITVWKTDNNGTSNNDQIEIPTNGSGYNYDIYWEDVSNPSIHNTLTNNTGNVVITFPDPGTYRVEIYGDFPTIYFNDEKDKEKILDIEQWGVNVWVSLQHAFFGCANLTMTATDTPDLTSSFINADGMFAYATSFNHDIGGWNVSNVISMNSMFRGATSFNQNIGSWNVNSSRGFSSMFKDATSFNQDIGSWNVAPWANLSAMFHGATSFNQNISSWDVSLGRSLANMFNGATSFDQDLSNWDVSNCFLFDNMFSNSGMSIANYDLTLIGWSNLTLQSDMTIGVDELAFCEGESARQSIINAYNWTFDGDSLYCHEYVEVTSDKYFGDITISLFPGTDEGPYYYLLSDSILPENLEEYFHPLSNDLGINLNALDGTHDTLAHTFENVRIGKYYVGAYNDDKQVLFTEEVWMYPDDILFSNNVDIDLDSNKLTATDTEAVCDMLLYIDETVPFAQLGFEFPDVSEEYIFGFVEDTVVLDRSMDVVFGFHVNNGDAKTIIDGVISSTPYSISDDAILEVKKNGDQIEFIVNNSIVETEPIPSGKFSLKSGLKFEVIGHVFIRPIKLRPRRANIAFTIFPILCNETTTNIEVEVANTWHPVWTNPIIDYTLYDDDGDPVGSAVTTHLPTTFNDLEPGNYSVIGTITYTTLFGSAVLPLTATIPVGHNLEWDNFQKADFNAGLKFLFRDQQITQITGGATLNNYVDLSEENWFDFEFSPNTGINIHGLTWGTTATANGDITDDINNVMVLFTNTNAFWPVGIAGGVFHFNGLYDVEERYRIAYDNDDFKLYKLEKNSPNKVLLLTVPWTSSSSLLNAFVGMLETGLINVNTNMVCSPPIIYAKMERNLKGVKYKPIANEVYFYYNEEYYDDNGELNFNVFDEERQVVINQTNQSVINNYGDNRNSLDVSSLSAGAYTLEITNDKREVFYLRFVKP